MITKHSSFTLDWPADWPSLFGQERPLIVEIGFGNGDHLIHLAEARPDANVVGLEIASQSMDKAERKIASRGLTNCIAVHSRGETALHHLLEPATVSEFHINFPDPWFKKRHSGRRLMQRDTLDAIVNRLQPDGWLYLATDVLPYAEMSHELLSATPGLTNTLDRPWTDHLSGRFVTKYEQKGIREGRPPNYFIYRRNHEPAPVVPVKTELDMPHLILKTPMSMQDILQQTEKTTHHAGDDIYVMLIHAYINKFENVLLFEIKVEEPTIDQQIAFLLLPRETEGEYLLRLGNMGHARPTLGLHRAAGYLADWICSLHPDAAVSERRIKT